MNQFENLTQMQLCAQLLAIANIRLGHKTFLSKMTPELLMTKM
jgi:hypothetical protein